MPVAKGKRTLGRIHELPPCIDAVDGMCTPPPNNNRVFERCNHHYAIFCREHPECIKTIAKSGPRRPAFRGTSEERFLHYRIAEETNPIAEPWSDAYLAGDRDPCELWGGTINNSGYGAMYTSETGRNTSAHIFAWERVNGPVPEGSTIDHTDGRTDCVRVSHLRVRTFEENARLRVETSARKTAWYLANGLTPPKRRRRKS